MSALEVDLIYQVALPDPADVSQAEEIDMKFWRNVRHFHAIQYDQCRPHPGPGLPRPKDYGHVEDVGRAMKVQVRRSLLFHSHFHCLVDRGHAQSINRQCLIILISNSFYPHILSRASGLKIVLTED